MTTQVATSTLTSTGVVAGTYGSSSTIPVITVGPDGRVTSATGTAASGGSSGVGVTTFTRTNYTANVNQSSFAASYTPGYVQVFMNGILLAPSDYAAASGTSVVLSANAAGGEIVDIISYYITSVNNITGGQPGAIVYQTAANTTGFTGVGTSGQILLSAGASAPVWGNATNTAVGMGYTSNTQFLSLGIGNPASGNTGDIKANTITLNTSLGVGTPASNVAGEIRAANDITAFYSSDISLKENVEPIANALSKVEYIGGKTFDWKETFIEDRGGEDGYFMVKHDFGVIAQDVEAVFPEAVRTRPSGIKVVDYAKLSALAFQAIIELKQELDQLKGNK